METVIARTVRLLCAGGALAGGLLAVPALAQDANVQRVEITGSSLASSPL